MTADEATVIQQNRRLIVRPVKADAARGTPAGWIAETEKGTRLHRTVKSTPVEAIEAAELALQQTEQQIEEQRASRVLSAVSRGRYFLRPRTVSTVDAEGNPTTAVVFDAFRPDNSPVASVRGRDSYIQAVIDMEALLGP